MEHLDIVVVGAGVIGLAIGRELATSGRDVIVLEAESQIGTHSSSRNSEVIHAGIYYPTDSLKARLCVQGKKQLYAYCVENGISHMNIGKLIVATGDDDKQKLGEIQQQAERNGVNDLRMLHGTDARNLEPHVECIAALLSPSTGIVDSHAYMLSLQADIEVRGGEVVLNSRVCNPVVSGDGFEFEVDGEKYRCKTLVNSAGLSANELWSQHRAHHLPGQAPEYFFAKGHYFAYQGKSPFNHLVYPIPSGGGLGIHATNDLGGAARFGPDVVWIDTVDYSFDESRKSDFVDAIRRYFPALDASKLIPGYTGIRPKLSKAGPPADFVVQGETDHGVPGLVNLFGIESPGLTASLAIAEYVRQLLE